MRNLGSSTRAIAILAAAGVVAFAVSTAAVSSATTSSGLSSIKVKYHFTSFSFTGGVSTSAPARPSTFSLSFTTSFALPANSPGIVNTSARTLDNITIEEHVSYPVPAAKARAQFVGPAQLPFSSEKLALVVAIKGKCFISQPASGDYVFRGSLNKCATATLTLGNTSYKVSSLLKSITGTFTPSQTGAPQWTGSLSARFASPGYTFPVATLGSGGGTSLIIGANGGTLATRSITFGG